MSDSFNAKIQNKRVSYQYDLEGQMQRTESLEKASHVRFASLEDETRKTQQDIARQDYDISECRTQIVVVLSMLETQSKALEELNRR